MTFRRPQQGMTTLAIAVMLLASMSFVVLFSANSGVMTQRIATNQMRAQQAFEAAEAGLEIGIQHLTGNHSAILVDGDSDGFIDAYTHANTTNVTLTNGTQYNVTYRNTTPNDLELIRITSTGLSDDDTATRTISQLVKFSPLLIHYSPYSVVVGKTIDLLGNTRITNLSTDLNLRSGAQTSLSGSAATYTSSGLTSDKKALGSDVDELNATLAGWSSNDFFNGFFGSSKTITKKNADFYYENSTNTNYDVVLNGIEGAAIWIEQTGGEARIKSGTIGSVENPVLLIVNGNVRLGGTTTIYGLLYVTQDLNHATGQAQIIGGFVSEGNVRGAGNFTMSYDGIVLENMQQSVGSFSKISGSWRDF